MDSRTSAMRELLKRSKRRAPAVRTAPPVSYAIASDGPAPVIHAIDPIAPVIYAIDSDGRCRWRKRQVAEPRPIAQSADNSKKRGKSGTAGGAGPAG